VPLFWLDLAVGATVKTPFANMAYASVVVLFSIYSGGAHF
jgi:hypothetical protein